MAVQMEQTLALIKPDALQYSEDIKDIIRKENFTIIKERRLWLSPEEASDFYAEHYGKLFFPSLVHYMSSGPILALVLSKHNALEDWRKILGPPNPKRALEQEPGSLRAKYGSDETRNGLHGSDGVYSAEKEIRFMFPGTITEPLLQNEDVKDYLTKTITPVLLRGVAELCKIKPADPVLWLSDWLLANNPNKPKVEEPTQ